MAIQHSLGILQKILVASKRESQKILQRDKRNTASLNAGWTLSAMAGELSVQLEKPGFYKLGDNKGPASTNIIKALRIMGLTAILFGIFIIFPLLVAKTVIIIYL